MKKSQENKVARQQEIKKVIDSQKSSGNMIKGKEEEKQQKKKSRPSKFKIGEIKKGPKQEEEKPASPMQLDSLFEKWAGKQQLAEEQ